MREKAGWGGRQGEETVRGEREGRLEAVEGGRGRITEKRSKRTHGITSLWGYTVAERGEGVKGVKEGEMERRMDA